MCSASVICGKVKKRAHRWSFVEKSKNVLIVGHLWKSLKMYSTLSIKGASCHTVVAVCIGAVEHVFAFFHIWAENRGFVEKSKNVLNAVH